MFVPKVALVIEDEFMIRFNIVDELTERGWTVLETDSGEEAVALFATADVDVVLTDIELAGQLSGWDVAETLREYAERLPVIYVSARPADDARIVSNSLFFSKPYDMGAVAESCSRLLCRSRH